MPAQTTIQVRRGTASSWTSTNPTLAAGEVGFETDTGKFKIGTGSAVWTSLSYFNPGNTSPLTTKGDLFTYSTTDARLPVGSNGYTLVADSSTSTGLAYAPTLFAGKNKIINGDFNIWQRGTSFTSVANGTYTSDRWVVEAASGSGNVTQQSFTAGSELGNNQYFLRFTKSTTGDRGIAQRIEDVRTLAGQTITVSFWMKGSVSGSLDSVLIIQRFGSGGSSEVVTNALSSQAFTTSWVRYSATVTLPSISGKTIGAGNSLTIRIDPADAFTGDFDVWGVQVEAGSVATSFQTATGTIQGELALAQRYYQRITPGAAYARFGMLAFPTAATTLHIQYAPPVQLRITPTAIDSGGNIAYNDPAAGTYTGISGFSIDYASPNCLAFVATTTGASTSRVYPIRTNNDATAYIGFSAEL